MRAPATVLKTAHLAVDVFGSNEHLHACVVMDGAFEVLVGKRKAQFSSW